MSEICISNPPYNLKWQVPPRAQMQNRFAGYVVPPEGNANFAFVLSGMENCERAGFILPQGALSPNNTAEKEIIKSLVEKNYIEAVITCPDKMFEKTPITVCILLLNKNKDSAYTEFIYAGDIYKTEIREQRGQFGAASHMSRVYKKEIKVFDDEIINRISNAVKNKTDEKDFCGKVSIEKIKQNNYCLDPGRYIAREYNETPHRAYEDIVNDLNRVIREKNCCKLTINKTIAKEWGFNPEFYNKTDMDDMNMLLQKLGTDKIIKDNYISFTRNKNELKFENTDKENVSSILIMIMQMWKQHIYYLNTEENRYLAELRDAVLPDLMGGKIDLS